MRFNDYIVNENMVDKFKLMAKRLDFRKFKTILKGEFDKFVETVVSVGVEPQVIALINKRFDTRYHSLRDIQKQKLRESTENLNEDISHWWDVVKAEAFPTLAFYPALQVWLEIDKLLQGQDVDMKKTIVYALFWILLISGKYVKGWMKWKEQNPDEYNKERSAGKGGIV